MKMIAEPELLRDVHVGLPNPEPAGVTFLVKGSYMYYHYDCDGFQDQGWGCGYRTLQTICSHIRLAKETAGRESTARKETAEDETKTSKETAGDTAGTSEETVGANLVNKIQKETPGENSTVQNEIFGDDCTAKTKTSVKKPTSGKKTAGEKSRENEQTPGAERKNVKEEPTLCEIQEALVAMLDKPESFLGSRDWIGSIEVSLCLDFYHNVPGKIIHLNSGQDLPGAVPELTLHFRTHGTPIMMGGDSDSSSKGILGVHVAARSSYLLILDPHFTGTPTISELQKKGWVSWKRTDSFMASSFYNLCLPQYTVQTPR